QESQWERAAAGRRGRDSGGQTPAERREVTGDRLRRIRDPRLEVRPPGRRGRGAPGIEPGQHLGPGHRPSSLRTMAEAWARASDSLAGSPAPADAKCARPPPLPPDTAAMAPAISPAFTPSLTRSSVTAT